VVILIARKIETKCTEKVGKAKKEKLDGKLKILV
jgi:hypothetical protein